MTLTGVEDSDSTDETVTVTHTAAGGGYGGVAVMKAAVTDNDRGVTLSETVVLLTEGSGEQQYTVALASRPDATVEVLLTSDDAGAVTVSPHTLTFTTGTWHTAQTVTLTAVDNRTATVRHRPYGGGYSAADLVNLAVTVQLENLPGIPASGNTVTAGDLTVTLNSQARITKLSVGGTDYLTTTEDPALLRLMVANSTSASHTAAVEREPTAWSYNVPPPAIIR